MPKRDHSSNSQFTHQLFHGTTWHSRLLPSVHKFIYPYRYWGVNISALAAGDGLPEVASMQLQNNHTHSAKLFNKLPFGAAIIKGLPIFSAKHKALQQFYADDYLQGLPLDQANQEIATDANVDTSADANVKSIEGLLQRLNAVFKDKTGSTPTGEIIGLVVCRNVGVYFSPVNFYIGFDSEQTPTHLLAEVSNTPWDKRHYYGFLLKGAETELCHDKDFHVSPFNPIDQLYRWQVSIKPQPSKSNKANKNDIFDIRIAINISDKRGEVLKTGIKMSGEPMTHESIRQSLKQNPLMNFTSLTRIYWHAFKLYAFKKVPYINYDEKLADSEQSVNN